MPDAVVYAGDERDRMIEQRHHEARLAIAKDPEERTEVEKTRINQYHERFGVFPEPYEDGQGADPMDMVAARSRQTETSRKADEEGRPIGQTTVGAPEGQPLTMRQAQLQEPGGEEPEPETANAAQRKPPAANPVDEERGRAPSKPRRSPEPGKGGGESPTRVS